MASRPLLQPTLVLDVSLVQEGHVQARRRLALTFRDDPSIRLDGEARVRLLLRRLTIGVTEANRTGEHPEVSGKHL
jgi:hypothetical protein